MRIEVERFSDKRLKLIKLYDSENDQNIRIDSKVVSVCPKFAEVELERDVLEAINLWNLMFMFPKLKDEIIKLLKHYGIYKNFS